MKLTSPLLTFLALVLTAAPGVLAAPPSDGSEWCGTSPYGLKIEVAQHAANQRRLAREQAGGELVPKVIEITRRGNVAVAKDDGTFLVPANTVDLHEQSFQFQRRATGVAVNRSGEPFRDQVGERITIGDDATVEIPFEGFRFRFGGGNWASVFLNSDGNLTFGVGDNPSIGRTVDRILGGPPRIAPLFMDLDPSVTSGDDGVFVAALANRLRITWRGVPEFGTTNRNTFQVTLFADGRIIFAYSDELDAQEAIVGVAPFPEEDLELVDFDDAPFPARRQVRLEQFTTQQSFDESVLTQAFYRRFRDVHDFVVIWTDFPIDLEGAFAYALTLQSDTRGIGLPPRDFSEFFGSDGELETVIQMGFVGEHSTNRNEIVNRTYTTLATLAHEIGHRWLTRVMWRDPEGTRPVDTLIGAGNAHWSFFLDTGGSLMEGNAYVDNGDGTFTTTDATTTRFSSLDLYLMGLILARDVGPFYFIDNGQGTNTNGSPLQRTSLPIRPGITVTGQRFDTNVQRIRDLEGPRLPGPGGSQKGFRVGFILVTQDDQPDPELLARLDLIRRQIPGYFRSATSGLAGLNTRLEPR